MADVSAVHQIEITAKDSTGGVFSAVENEIRSLDGVTGDLGTRLATLSGLLGSLGTVVGVGAFAGAIAGAINYQASLANLAQRTGATVEALSAMHDAAMLSDTGMDTVATTMQRFAASVVAAQTGTGKQASALQALGFNAQTFAKQYTTTDQALVAVARALDQYKEGLGKTAIEENLMGKSGAQLGAFMHQLAEDGIAAAKVTTDQANASRALNDEITKLKIAWDDLLNKLGVQLVPVLTAVVKGFDTFATIGAAALVTFVAWPAVVGAVTAAIVAYKDAVISAALANDVLGASTTVLGSSWAATVASATAQFGTLTGLLKTLPALLFAGFAGWELGKWLSDNFLQAKLAGIAFVDGTMTALEYLKYGAGVAWAAIQYAWDNAVEAMKTSFASFLALVSKGLSYVPGLGDFAKQVNDFAASLAGGSGTAMATFQARLAELGADFDSGRAKVHGITSDMADYAIAAANAGKASAAAAKAPAPVPAAAAKSAQDATKALTELLKALEQYSIAAVDAQAKSQQQAITSAQADVKRMYDEGILDAQHYWETTNALAATSLAVQKQQLEQQLGYQQTLVTSLQNAVNAIDPSKFKTQQDYLRAAYAAEAQLVTASGQLVKTQGDLNVVTQKTTDIGKDYIENYLIPASNGLLQTIPALDKAIDERTRENEQIGLTQSQILALDIARVEDLRLVYEMAGPAGQAYLAFLDLELDRLNKLRDATAQGETTQNMVDGWKNLFQSAASEGEKFINDFAQHGSSAFKNLWSDFKTWALDAFAKIAAQTIVVNLAEAFVPSAAGIAANTFAGGGNGLLSLLTGGSNILSGASSLLSGGSGLTSLLTGVPAAASYMAFGGASASQAAILAAQTADFGAAGTASTLSALGASGALSTLGAAVPYIGLALAAASAFGLFDKKPSPVSGQFKISSGTSGFEDNAYVPSAFGNLGFNDANTQQFSGKGAEVFDQVVAGAIDAFNTRFSADQSAHFADVLKTMTFQTFSGTFTTQDFLQKYGGQVLQQVVTAAFQVLDPALASVMQGFKGTADQVSTFANSLLSIYDITKQIGNADFTANVDAALQGADQTTADNVSAFTKIVLEFNAGLPDAAAELEQLSGTDIPDFVNALGGASAALSTADYLYQNFTTSAQKTTAATETLNADFAALGVSVPKSHQAFLDLLDSIDLTTPAGRQLYASIAALAPLFVQVHGTADQAAGALANAAGAMDTVTSSAQQIVVSVGELTNAGIAQANKLLSNIQSLANGSTGDFGEKLSTQISLIANAIRATGATLSASGAYYYPNPGGAAGEQTASYLDQLDTTYVQLSSDLARYTVLAAQYGASQAEQLVQLQDWLTQQNKLFSGNASALAAVQTIYQEKWNAIVSGTASGVSGVQDQLTQLQQSILQYVQGLMVGSLSPLSPMDQLNQAQSQYQAELVKAQAGDQGALGDITKYSDTYLNLLRGAYASSPAYTQGFNQVVSDLSRLAAPPPTATLATSPTAQLAAALPVNGTLASSSDVSQVVAALKDLQTAVKSGNAASKASYQELIAALADSNSADAQAIIRQLKSGTQLSAALADKQRVTSTA